MKKTILFAGIAAMLCASCVKEEAPYNATDKNADNMATIQLAITNDDAMLETRASDQTADLSSWKASVTPKALDGTAAGTTHATGWVVASSLGSFAPGGYSISVSNYATESEIYSLNGGKGDAYYTGSVDQALVKGSNSVVIDCGAAKNCRVKADLSGITGVAGITDVVLKANQTGEKSRDEYTFENNDVAYFYASNTINYTLDYKYNNEPMTQVVGSIPTPEAAKEYQITVGTTDNGKIVLTIKYDQTFTSGANSNVTIDAATGTQVTQQ